MARRFTILQGGARRAGGDVRRLLFGTVRGRPGRRRGQALGEAALLAAVIGAGAYLALQETAPARPDAVSPALLGAAYVADGDTLRVGATRIRLSGVDAPETSARCKRRVDSETIACGRIARAELSRLIGGRAVSCAPEGEDRYGRALAVCHVGEGPAQIDLGRVMVRNGWALAYLSNRYDADEAAARRDGLGLWAFEFETPADQRARERSAGRAAR